MASGPVQVVASLVLRENRVLLCQRPLNKEHGGQWELPAGRVEEGETTQAAVTRVLARDLGVAVNYVAMPVWRHDYPARGMRILFVPTEFAGEPRCLHHAALKWETPQAALALDLSTLIRTFVETVLLRQTDTTMA